MANDPNPALRAELTTALEVIKPQIRGLHDLAAVSISAELRAEIVKNIGLREHRRDLLNNVLIALDHVVDQLRELEADGYPALDPAVVQQSLVSELAEENKDIVAAAAVFVADRAAAISVVLGAPVEKNSPTPEGE